jgi:hypothetical protein
MKILNVMIQLLAILLLSICAYGQKKNNHTYHQTVCLFMKAEKKIIEHKEYLDRHHLFEDPIGYKVFWFKTFKKESPSLFQSTSLYKDDLLNMLGDSVIKKNPLTNYDIVRVLYKLCLKDYMVILYRAYEMLQKNQISSDVFLDLLFQDYHVSNQIAQNYKNEQLQIFLDMLQKDNKLNDRYLIQNVDFKKMINELKTGALWESELKEQDQIQPPLLR